MAGEVPAVRAGLSLKDVWYVYVVRCSVGSLYTGIARDVMARIEAHDSGKGARYTRGRGPVKLCAKRRCMSKGAALRLELSVKALPRVKKEAIATTGRFPRG